MLLRKFAWRFPVAAMGLFCLEGCTSAAVQTPTLSYWDPGNGVVVHSSEFPTYKNDSRASNDSSISNKPNPFSTSYALTFAPNVNTDRTAVHNEFYYHPLPYNLKYYVDTGERLDASSLKDAPKRYWERKEFRNFVQNDLLRRSDQICSAYLTRIINGLAVGNVIGSTVKSTLGALQTLAAPALLTDAFQVTSAGMAGFGSLEMLQFKALTDTSQKILKSRRAVRNSIRGAQQEETTVYSVSQALYDAERYHTLCNYPTQWVADNEIASAESEIILVKTDPPGRTEAGAKQGEAK